MKNLWMTLLVGAGAIGMAGCAHVGGGNPQANEDLTSATNVLLAVKAKYTPDSHIGVFKVGVEPRGSELVLTGEVLQAQARVDAVAAVRRLGLTVKDEIEVLPQARLGDETWAISCLSVATARELPEHKAEMGTQIWMGNVVRVLKRNEIPIFAWYQIQSSDGYVAWVEKGGLVRCTREQAEAWKNGPLLIVTSLEDRIVEKPQADAQPVSDVVICDLVKRVGEEGDWYKVELPDKRAGYLAKSAATDYAAWRKGRQPTPENIERTARQFVGRPYLWGGNSPKGVDCSGFTKTVFFLNGIELNRNASEQALQGTALSLDDDLAQLKKGDLLFFGHRAENGRPERVTHVAIYLGNKRFIQSSQRVEICSLDPNSPDADDYRIESLIRARRVLPQ
jgi:cell wall-associated NlpC family hydrolase